MRLFFALLIGIIYPTYHYGQQIENFADGDFTSGVIWQGDTDKFLVEGEVLRSNYAPQSTSTYYLSTSSQVIYDATWEFYIRLDFATSSVNYVDIFLAADQLDLNLAQNGYFVRIGDTADEITLYKKSNGDEILMIDDANRQVDGTSNNIFTIRVTRSTDNLFTLSYDDGNQGTFVSIGTAIDAEINASSAFGFKVKQSTASSPINSHFFDDILISGSEMPDQEAPFLTHLSVISAHEVLLTFNETLDPISSENTTVYVIDPSIGIQLATRQGTAQHQVLLQLAQPMIQGNFYHLTIDEISDMAGNSAMNITESFEFLTFSAPQFREIVINEWLPAPGNNQLPNQEYIELYNATKNRFFNTAGLSISDESGSSVFLNSDTLRPGKYLLIAQDTSLYDASLYKMSLNLPTLNNSGDRLYLSVQSGAVIDSVNYTSVSNQSYEQVNPEISFFLNENYQESIDSAGGTPGLQNSRFDTTPDTTAPLMTDVMVLNDDSLLLSFNEKLDVTTINILSNYTVVNQSIKATDAIYFDKENQVVLSFDSSFDNGKLLTLSVSGVADLFGNTTQQESNFTYYFFSKASIHDVLINEFLVAPNDREFIELYNPTLNYFNLENWIIEDNAGNQQILPAHILPPDAFVVLSGSFGSDSLQLSGFPFLNNSSDSILLLDDSGEMIHSIGYTGYQENNSYELINPAELCKGIFNYAINQLGNTAGIKNDQYDISPDVTAPELLNIELLDYDSVFILFNEPLNPSQEFLNKIFVDGDPITKFDISTDRTRLAAQLLKSLVDEQPSQLVVSTIEDCIGNVADSLGQTLYIDHRPPQLINVTILSATELGLFFHEPIEHITSSDQGKFSMTDQSIAKVTKQDTSQCYLKIETENELILDQKYELRINGIEDTLGNALIDSLQIIYISDIVSWEVISSHSLDLSFQSALGTSLLHRFDFILENEKKAHSVEVKSLNSLRLKFNDPFEENRPLRLYMFNIMDTTGNRLSTPAIDFIYDTKPPRIKTWTIPQRDSVLLIYDEPISITSAINLNHYRWNSQLPQAVIALSDTSTLLQPLQTLSQEVIYKLEISGVEDLKGNKASKQYYNLIYDTIAPKIITAFQSSLYGINIRTHEKLDTSLLLTAGYISEADTIYAVSHLIQPEEVKLSFNDSIPQVENLKVFLSGLSDIRGNGYSKVMTLDINTFYPSLVKVDPITPSVLSLTFNQLMSHETLKTENFDILNNAVVAIDQIGTQFQITLADSMQNKTSYELKMNGLRNSSMRPIQDTLFQFEFMSLIKEVTILNENKIAITFEEELNRDAFLDIQVEGLEIDYQSTIYHHPSTYEVIFASKLPENQSFQVKGDSTKTKGGRILPAFDYTLIYDTKSPEITEINSEFFDQILISFSEPIIFETLSVEQNFELIESSQMIRLEKVSSSVLKLSFEGLERGKSYSLIYKNIADLQSNLSPADTITFQYLPPLLPRKGEIIITEIMADPVPSVQLPEVEYLEIVNLSQTIYQLKGIQLVTELSTVAFPDVAIEPGQFLAFGESTTDQVAKMQNFPSLLNASQYLKLQTVENEIIDEVNYNHTWYHSADKSSGGYSLELINLRTNCQGPANWSASIDPAGGTPGMSNSIESRAPDTIPPSITYWQYQDEGVLQLIFDEYLDTSNVAFDVGRLVFQSLDSVRIRLKEDLPKGAVSEIHLGGFSDCAGNLMSDTLLQIFNPRKPRIGELILTELMIDPDPAVGLPDSEYIELFNLSDTVLDLDSVYLNGVTLSGHLMPGEYLTIVPTSQSRNSIYSNSKSISPWIGLANEQDTLVMTVDEAVLLELYYDQSWFGHSEKSNGGYSLEIIDPTLYCDGPSNWTFSQSETGGTPGRQNSVYKVIGDQKSPEIVELLVNPRHLQVHFSEKIRSGSIQWQLSPLGWDQTVNEIDAFSNQVTLTLPDTIHHNQYFDLILFNVADCYLNTDDTISFSFIYPESSIDQLHINEVLFDPLPGSDDFIELFNATEDRYLDLGRLFWKIDESLTSVTDRYILAPSSYIALTENKLQLLFDFPMANPDDVVEVDKLPSMNNNKGSLVIVNAAGKVLDSIYYDKDFHSIYLDDIEGVSLERLTINTPAQNANIWTSASSAVGFATPGYKNSQQIRISNVDDFLEVEPRTFIPGSNNPNYAAMSTISVKNNLVNRLANAWVINSQGMIVKTLATGVLLGSQDYLIWDGSDEYGRKVEMGQYLIVVEMYGGDKSTGIFKKPVTVGAEF